MKRKYKPRESFEITCIDCNLVFNTSSFRTLRCTLCAKSSEYRKNSLDYKWRLNKLVASARYRSNDKSLPFDIDKDYLIDLWDQNNGKCLLSGRPFELTNWGQKGQVNPNAPSVDRIIPSLGYVKGNIRLITYHLNVALSEFGIDSFTALAKDVAAYK